MAGIYLLILSCRVRDVPIIYNHFYFTEFRAAPTVSDIVEKLSEITDPHRLGMHLGLKEEDLKKIETDYPATERQKSEIIYHWKRNFKPYSWKALADAVEKMGGHANLVEKLRALGDQELNDASQISEQGI